MIDKNIRTLLAEDLEADAELVIRALESGGVSCEVRRVDTAVDYRRELEQFQPHVILSDFSMPNFDGMEALRIASQSYSHIPFIFVSGTIGEEHAVRALKSGARDYVLKSNLLRLPAAVERAIKETDERRARRALEYQLRESEKLYRTLFQEGPHPMWTYDIETLRLLTVNNRAVECFGYSREELVGMTLDVLRASGVRAPSAPSADDPQAVQYRTKSGALIAVQIASRDISLDGRPTRIVVARVLAK